MGKKLSIDLTDENAEALKNIKRDQHIAFGKTINALIELFCRIPADIKGVLLTFCKERIKELYQEMAQAGEYETQMLMNNSQTYQKLATFLNYGRKISIDSIESKPKMQCIDMLNGSLICPIDYIILNSDDAESCDYASVGEVRNDKFGVTHFVYFHSKEFPQIGDFSIHIHGDHCYSIYEEGEKK